MQLGDGATPVACSLAQGDLITRRERWLRLCDRALAEKELTDDGARLRFRSLDGVKSELEELTALERDCCSFAAWTVNIEGTELVLHVSAKDDAVAAVHALSDDLPAPAGAGRSWPRPRPVRRGRRSSSPG